MFEAVWNFFEKHNWRINYKGGPRELAEQLRSFGVSHFAVLNYLHREGLRDSLAEWTRDFASSVPGAIPLGTLYPGEKGNLEAARRWFSDWGFLGLKVQPLVSKRPIPDPSMYPVFELMAQTGKWLVVHAGTAPYPNEFTSLDTLENLLRDVSGLNTILCHMGGYEYQQALDMLDRYPNLVLDTTMIFVDTYVFNSSYPLPMQTLEPYIDRIIFGSDFPNIPYDYRESIEGLIRYGFKGEQLRKVLRDNAARIFGL